MSENKISNYRPDGAFAGDAVAVSAGSSDVTFENNTILEATRAISVGEESATSPGPERIFFRRNYVENQLTNPSTGLLVQSGREIHFENNVVDRYTEPFRIGSGASGVSIANNLVIRAALAWNVASPEAFSLFDYNVFGGDAMLKGVVAGKTIPAADWISLRMPHSRLLPGVDLADKDLGKVVGFVPIDAGKAIEGLNFKGLAPDIGVAEH